MEKHAIEILSTADTVIWGRGTYQGMQSYWPSVPSNPSASQHERIHIEWNSSRLVKENVNEELKNLKQQAGVGN